MGAGAKSVDINVLKAAYLNKFAHFVSWPNNGEISDISFKMCIYKDGPLYDQLADKLKDRQIKKRDIEIILITKLNKDTDCQILYLGEPSIKDLASALKISKQNNILLITEHTGAADVGIHINLIRQIINEQNVLWFEVNQDSFKQSNLEVSFKLLKLAKKVVSTEGEQND